MQCGRELHHFRGSSTITGMEGKGKFDALERFMERPSVAKEQQGRTDSGVGEIH